MDRVAPDLSAHEVVFARLYPLRHDVKPDRVGDAYEVGDEDALGCVVADAVDEETIHLHDVRLRLVEHLET